jgi:hypothetical protein
MIRIEIKSWIWICIEANTNHITEKKTVNFAHTLLWALSDCLTLSANLLDETALLGNSGAKLARSLHPSEIL